MKSVTNSCMDPTRSEPRFNTCPQMDGAVIERILLHFKDHLETLTLFVNSNLATCTPKAYEVREALAV